jgi:hydrogenase maturation protease
MSAAPRILVAGIGNVFLGDDGFGVEVARRLAARAAPMPPGVEVADFGIRGIHLAYQLLDGYDGVILVDTVHRDGPPGTVYRLEHDLSAPTGGEGLDAHGMDPSSVLALLDELAAANGVDRPVRRVLVVGCEPADVGPGADTGSMGLSPPVAAAVGTALRTVDDLIDLLHHDAADVRPAPEGARS